MAASEFSAIKTGQSPISGLLDLSSGDVELEKVCQLKRIADNLERLIKVMAK